MSVYHQGKKSSIFTDDLPKVTLLLISRPKFFREFWLNGKHTWVSVLDGDIYQVVVATKPSDWDKGND